MDSQKKYDFLDLVAVTLGTCALLMPVIYVLGILLMQIGIIEVLVFTPLGDTIVDMWWLIMSLLIAAAFAVEAYNNSFYRP